MKNLYDFNVITSLKQNENNLYAIETDENICIDNSILILKNSADISKIDMLVGNSIVIVNSENKQQLKQLAEKNAKTITCGLSGKDTITFSSRCENKVVLSLQRSLKNIYGQSIEPFEKSININKEFFCEDEYSIFSFFALSILANL